MPPLSSGIFSSFSLLVVLMSGLVLGLTGCAPPKPQTDPFEDAKARSLIMTAQDLNRDIATTKGSGSLILDMGQTRERFTMAWAAQAPTRLRLTLLASGHPVETLAASGERVAIVSHTGRHRPHHTVSADPDLTPYINMPVRLSDMVTLLLGRYPLQPFDRAWFVPEYRDQVRTSLNFSSHIQEIQFNRDGQIESIALLDKKEQLVYQIRYTAYQILEGRAMPQNITLTTATGQTHEIRLVHILPNEAIKPGVFRLTASGS